MYRLLINLTFILAFSSALIAQETKPANASPTTAPAQPSAPAAASAQPSPAKAASPAQGAAASKPAAHAPSPAQKNDEEEPAAPGMPSAAPAPKLPPATPVITLNFCQSASKTKAASVPAAANCKVVITKAQFDKVLDAAIPRNRRPAGGDVPQQVKQAVAKEYLNMYIMAHEAEKRGFPAKDPLAQEMLKLSRMQVLSMALTQELQENAKPSDVEVDNYYKSNPSAFMEVSLRRLYIPKPPQTPPANTANAGNPGANAANAASANANNPTASASKPADPEAQKAAAEAQKGAAEKLHARAAAGEDLDKLEKEAFDSAGSKQTPPPTQMGNRRRGILPPDQDAEVFALNPGEVSKLFDNPGGWYLYKVESKRTIPFTEAKEEIQRKLQPDKLKDAREAITAKVKSDLNDEYFGSPTAPMTGAAPGKTRAMPGASAARPSSTAPKTSGTPKTANPTETKVQPEQKANDTSH